MINWPPDVAGKIAAIKSVWEPGLSQAQIAARLGIERNAVIGVFNRNPQLKIDCPPLSPTAAVRKANVGRKRVAQPLRFISPSKRLNSSPQLTVERVSEPPPISEPSPLNIALADLSAKQCRWPYGDGPFTFCGHHADGVYCAYHSRFGVGVGSPSERRAERVLRAEML